MKEQAVASLEIAWQRCWIYDHTTKPHLDLAKRALAERGGLDGQPMNSLTHLNIESSFCFYSIPGVWIIVDYIKSKMIIYSQY